MRTSLAIFLLVGPPVTIWFWLTFEAIKRKDWGPLIALLCIGSMAAGMILICGCTTTNQGQLQTEVVPPSNSKGGLSPETTPSYEEPEPTPSVEVASSTTELIPDPSPVFRLGQTLAVEPSTQIQTNNSPLIKSLPNHRLVRPRTMSDLEWDTFLKKQKALENK